MAKISTQWCDNLTRRLFKDAFYLHQLNVEQQNSLQRSIGNSAKEVQQQLCG
jgi:hypothetical protein